MAEHSEALERIANAIEQFSREATQSRPDPWFTLFVGAFVVACFALIGRYIVWEVQQRRLNKRKRTLFAGLLGDEIELRWRGQIGKDLEELFSKDCEIEHARSFCKDMRISQDDLPIFTMAYNNLLDLNVFVRRSLLSHTIYVYALINDLVNAQDSICDLLQRYDDETDRELRRQIEDQIKDNWQNIKKLIINEIFQYTDLIFKEIENDYKITLSERKLHVRNDVMPNRSNQIFSNTSKPDLGPNDTAQGRNQ